MGFCQILDHPLDAVSWASYISEVVGHLEDMTQRVIAFRRFLQVVCRVLSNV